jgi:pimeloyl-ACP methyl ester carboxylesterase
MEISSKFIIVGKNKVHYLESGMGQQIVLLLHGGGLDSGELSWELLIPELAKKARVIALDWPGYGKSDKPDVLFDLPFYLNFFPQFMDAIEIQQADLVGVSMGGAIGLGCALDYPQRVNKLVLVDSYGLQRKAPFHKLSYLFVRIPGMRALTYWSLRSRSLVKYSLGMILKRPGSVTEDLVEKVYRQLLIPGGTKAFSDFQNADISWQGLKTNFLDRLPELKVKTLVIHGGKDTLVPLEASEEAHQLIQNSEMVIMEGCGHWPQRDNPEEFNRLVSEFLLNQ